MLENINVMCIAYRVVRDADSDSLGLIHDRRVCSLLLGDVSDGQRVKLCGFLISSTGNTREHFKCKALPTLDRESLKLQEQEYSRRFCRNLSNPD